MKNGETIVFGPWTVLAIGAVLGCLLCLWMFGWPYYSVWEQGMVGRAKLSEAEFSKQVATLDAKAKLESATMLADAEVARAKGVAEANKIIGEGLKGHEEYLMYLWVQSLSDKDNHVIYIPTEANIPILEAGRFRKAIENPEK